jgi:CheY-like chemotaxis protein
MDPVCSPAVDVLIAEDDAVMRKSLRSLLEREGYRCAEAENGIEAVDLARRHPPQCVFLDLSMPGMGGLDVVRQLRADERTRRAHIHCLTGLADPAIRQQAGHVGFELFLTKPVDPQRILEVVHRQVQRLGPGPVSGLSKTEAEDLLDALENQGSRPELAYSQEQGFIVGCAGFPEIDPNADTEVGE